MWFPRPLASCMSVGTLSNIRRKHLFHGASMGLTPFFPLEFHAIGEEPGVSHATRKGNASSLALVMPETRTLQRTLQVDFTF